MSSRALAPKMQYATTQRALGMSDDKRFNRKHLKQLNDRDRPGHVGLIIVAACVVTAIIGWVFL